MDYENFTKTDIIGHLARTFGYRNYVELCTTTTGNFYRNIDRAAFDSTRRLMYRCPPSFDDGLAIDFRCEGSDITDGLAKLRESRVGVDICLVDGFHVYDEARRDLAEAYDLLRDGGILVVRDCMPPTLESAAPDFVEGEWCGVAYQAFLDFVIDKKTADYCTVNCDYGCGIIIKNRTISFSNGGGRIDAITRLAGWRPYGKFRRDPGLIARWKGLEGSHHETYRLFDQNRKELLKLVSPQDFAERFEFFPAFRK